MHVPTRLILPASVIGLLIALLGVSTAGADEREAAGRFVQERVVEAFHISTGGGADEQKRARLDAFLKEHFDTRRFARLGLGDEYEAFHRTKTKNGTLTEEQLTKLREIYDQHVRDEVIDYFLLYLNDLVPESFVVTDTTSVGDGRYVAIAVMDKKDDPAAQYVFEFDVGRAGDGLRAFNVRSGDTNFADLIGGNEVDKMQGEYGDPVKFLYSLDEIDGWSSWY